MKSSSLRVDDLLPMLFNFELEYTIKNVQENHKGFGLNGTHELLVYTDDNSPSKNIKSNPIRH
jgi:hypothetical protein